MSIASDAKSAGDLGRSGDSRQTTANGSSTARSSSFVFTSTKVAQFVASNSAVNCVLTPVQVQTHAIGAIHALPTHSTFRRLKEEDRPSPIRQVLLLPEQQQYKPSGKRFQPRQRLSRAGISLYLEAIGRTSSPSVPCVSPRTRSLCSLPQSDTSPLLSPVSDPTTVPRHTTQITSTFLLEQKSTSNPPITPTEFKELTQSYFPHCSRRTPSPL